MRHAFFSRYLTADVDIIMMFIVYDWTLSW